MSEKKHIVSIDQFSYAGSVWLRVDGMGVLIESEATVEVIKRLMETLELLELREVQQTLNQAIQSRVVKIEGPRYTRLEVGEVDDVRLYDRAMSPSDLAYSEQQRELEAAYDAERQYRPIKKESK